MNKITNNKLADALENGYFVSIDSKTVPVPTVKDIYVKLSKYEKIEEELGIDLIMLFKALSNGCYYKTINNNIKYCSSVSLSYKHIETDEIIHHLSNYGKTWALTKEELEQ